MIMYFCYSSKEKNEQPKVTCKMYAKVMITVKYSLNHTLFPLVLYFIWHYLFSGSMQMKLVNQYCSR